jgi:hypothetical protein
MATRYILELCDTSGKHRPVARFESATPFHALHVGERFDDTGWNRLDGAGVIATPEQPIRYTVHSIKHLVEETPLGLVVRYCVNLEPYSGPQSPVSWKE